MGQTQCSAGSWRGGEGIGSAGRIVGQGAW
jgi:hypothetical protein